MSETASPFGVIKMSNYLKILKSKIMKKEIRIQKTKSQLEIATAKFGHRSAKTISLRIKLHNLLNL
jgi:hypothetical protein